MINNHHSDIMSSPLKSIFLMPSLQFWFSIQFWFSYFFWIFHKIMVNYHTRCEEIRRLNFFLESFKNDIRIKFRFPSLSWKKIWENWIFYWSVSICIQYHILCLSSWRNNPEMIVFSFLIALHNFKVMTQMTVEFSGFYLILMIDYFWNSWLGLHLKLIENLVGENFLYRIG
jgi:hypothetical protein